MIVAGLKSDLDDNFLWSERGIRPDLDIEGEIGTVLERLGHKWRLAGCREVWVGGDSRPRLARSSNETDRAIPVDRNPRRSWATSRLRQRVEMPFRIDRCRQNDPCTLSRRDLGRLCFPAEPDRG